MLATSERKKETKLCFSSRARCLRWPSKVRWLGISVHVPHARQGTPLERLSGNMPGNVRSHRATVAALVGLLSQGCYSVLHVIQVVLLPWAEPQLLEAAGARRLGRPRRRRRLVGHDRKGEAGGAAVCGTNHHLGVIGQLSCTEKTHEGVRARPVFCVASAFCVACLGCWEGWWQAPKQVSASRQPCGPRARHTPHTPTHLSHTASAPVMIMRERGVMMECSSQRRSGRAPYRWS